MPTGVSRNRLDVSAADARRIALVAHGVAGSGAPRLPSGGARRLRDDAQISAVRAVLDHQGAVQLDTISVLARSHELIAYSRLGPVNRANIESAYWPDPSGASMPAGGAPAFEYWSHAACILPSRLWPYFGFRRSYYAAREKHWFDVSGSSVAGVIAALSEQGPLTVSELGGGRAGTDWWDWSDAKKAVEFLLSTGQVVCVRRKGWRRVYDLPERALPGDVLWDADEADSFRTLITDAARTLGIATLADLADVHRLTLAQAKSGLRNTDLVSCNVEGWAEPAWAHPDALSAADSGSVRHRTTLLSPFDPIVWFRPRLERIFGMHHRLESYTPADKRQHGYFAMPVLHGGQLVGRVDPGRERGILVAKKITLETDSRGRLRRQATRGTAAALVEAARWVGAQAIRVDQVAPDSAEPAVRAELDEISAIDVIQPAPPPSHG